MDELLFNRFKIQQQLGRGGSGQVFQAYDVRMERNVAIKQIEKKPHTVPRAIREARTVALLTHPNIITVHDFLEDENFFYLVMEQVKGEILSKIISEQELTWKQAVAAMLQIAHALECAHSNNIIHRDIKPSNLILVPDGRVKVLDFGISRLKSSDVLTTHDQIIGTMAYISPEQARAEPLDERTDLFSLGIVSYEMLTGVNPFDAETSAATIFKILHNSPDHPSDINPQIPRGIGDAVVKLLEKDPDDRFNNSVEMRYRIERSGGKIDEQAELRKLIKVEEKAPAKVTKKRRISISEPLLNRILFGILTFILGFTVCRSANFSYVLSLALSSVSGGLALYVSRLGLLALLLLFTTLASVYYWWLGLLVLPILITYFAVTKHQKPALSFLPFTVPILANFGLGFSFPIIVGYTANEPVEVIGPSIVGGILLIIYDLFMRDFVRFSYIASPKLAVNNSSILVLLAEFGSTFIENPLLLIQPFIFAFAAIIFMLVKKTGNRKLALWSIILNIFILGGFWGLSRMSGGSKTSANLLLLQFAASSILVLVSMSIFNVFSKIKPKKDTAEYELA